MKIGILSFQQAINFGAVLQIYALQKKIKEIAPKNSSVEIINYIQPQLTKNNEVIKIKNTNVTGFLKSLPYVPLKVIKKNKFKKFFAKHMQLTNKTTNLDGIDLDVIFVGSDQVWNTDIHNSDKTYVLNIGQETQKVAYSASVGKKEINNEDKNYFSSPLKDFSAISVREASAATLLQQFVEVDIKTTLDPTLLLHANEWREISSKKNQREPYILVYTLQSNDELGKIALDLSRKLNLPLKYAVPKGDTLLDRTSLKYAYDPSDLLNLVDNSEFVLTNSFHGTCFSIIFQKKFITVPHLTRGTRMVELLENVSLENRIIRTLEEYEEKLDNLMDIDYDIPNIKLNNLQNDSIKFIENSISELL